MKRFCYRKPVYPPHAFVACLRFEQGEEVVKTYPLTLVYTSLAEFQYDIQLLLAKNEHMKEVLAETVLALPVVFDRLWRLKPEYWDTPDISFTQENRERMFVGMVDKYQFYTLLATPMEFKKPYTQTAAVCPFLTHSSDATIETFMKTSNYPVPVSASHAALYRFEKPYEIQWKKT